MATREREGGNTYLNAWKAGKMKVLQAKEDVDGMFDVNYVPMHGFREGRGVRCRPF